MKSYFITLIVFLLISFDAKAQVISLSINGKQLKVFDSVQWTQNFLGVITAEEWCNHVLDSIDVDNEKVKTVRIIKNDDKNIPIIGEINHIATGFSSNRLYGKEFLNINIKDSIHSFNNRIIFDMLIFDLQYGKQRFYSAIKLYSGAFQNKLNKETLYSVNQYHFFNTTIPEPCFEFILSGGVLRKDKGYYLLADTIEVDLYLKNRDILRCSGGFIHAVPHLITKEKIKSIRLFIAGTIISPPKPHYFYRNYKKQIKELPPIPTKKLLSEQPYFYIFKFLPKKLYKKAVFLEYIMEIGDAEAEIWVYTSMKTVHFKVNLKK